MFPDRLLVKPRSTYYPEEPIDLYSLPNTDGYPYVECVTYKKWKPLGRVGMIVLSELDGKNPRSTYKLTRENEDGIISFYNDKKLDSILSQRKQLFKSYLYPFVIFLKNIVDHFCIGLE